MNLKEEDMLEMAKALTPYAELVFIQMAMAQALREQCDAIQRHLLATGRYGGIDDPSLVYTLIKTEPETARRFYADLDTRYRDAGFHDLPAGHCPALIAEHNLVQVENALMDAAEKYTGIPSNAPGLYLEKRRKYLDLLLTAVASQPGYEPSWKGKLR